MFDRAKLRAALKRLRERWDNATIGYFKELALCPDACPRCGSVCIPFAWVWTEWPKLPSEARYICPTCGHWWPCWWSPEIGMLNRAIRDDVYWQLYHELPEKHKALFC